MLNFPVGSEGDVFRAQNDTRYVYEDGAWRVIDGAFTHNPGPSAPLDPELGDLWVDTSECPPVLKIFDCDGNWIEIEGGGGTAAINFTPVITDDGTDQANTPGHVLTASAQNITGGTAPVESAYKWLVDGLTMGTNKIINIVSSFVGKIVSCEVTVAEPDGNGAVVRTAVYSKVIEVAGTINKPTVLAPADGAGSGTTRDIVTDEITAVEGGGIATCETELIESVDTTTDAPNVILTFPSDQGFGCFERGEVVQGFTSNFYSPDGTITNPERAVDGIESTYSITSNSATTIWETDLKNVTSLRFKIYAFSSDNVTTITLEDANGVERTEYVAKGEFDGSWTTINNPPSTLNKMTILPNDTTETWIYIVEVNGQYLDFSTNTSIIDIDDSDPYTITVDGGAWKGSVSGESGNTADQETKLTKETPYDTKLTLAGAKDLDVLNVGDVVKMGMDADVPYQPVSDSITKVESNTLDTDISRWVSAGGGGNPAYYPGGTYGPFDPTSNGYIYGTISPAPIGATLTIDNLKIPMVSGATKIRFQGQASTYAACDYELYDQNDNLVETLPFAQPASDNSTVNRVDCTFSSDFVLKKIIIRLTNRTTTGTKYIGGFGGLEVNGNKIVEGSSDVTLTLSGATDLAYFRKGDVVQETQLTTAVGFAFATSSAGADVNYPDTNAGDKVEIFKSANLDMTSTSEQAIDDEIFSRSSHLVFDLIDEKSDFNFSLLSTNWQVYSSVNGLDWVTEARVDTPTNQSVRSLFDSSRRTSRYAMLSYAAAGFSWKVRYEAKITLNQAYVDAFAAPHTPSQIPGFSEDLVKIIDIDDSVPSITVDGGEWSGSDNSGVAGWNQDKAWSDLPTSQPVASGKVLSNGFDGQDNRLTNGYVYWYNQDSDLTEIDISPASEVVIYPASGGSGTIKDSYSVNNGAPQSVSIADNGKGWDKLVTLPVPSGTLDSIQFIHDNTDPSGGVGFWKIEVDGRELVDADISGAPNPDTEVTCVSPLKAPTDWKIEGIEGNTLSLSHTSIDNSQVWVANDNQAGTDFYVTGPQIVDEPLLTADVELESSLFTTTPPGVDTLNNIVWEVNGVEQDAGTTNPYKPTGLTINTNYTVRVKHQGNTLDESPWSDQTTFTTGATRNLYTYYNERVEALVARIEALETLENP